MMMELVYVMQDENHGYDMKILDVSDFNNISVIATLNSGVDRTINGS